MPFQDWLVVVWWGLFVFVALPGIVLTSRLKTAARKAKAAARRKKIAPATGPAQQAVPRALSYPLRFISVVLVVAAFVLAARASWTRISLLNLWAFALLFGAAATTAGLSARLAAKMVKSRRPFVPLSVQRALFVVFGGALVIFAALRLIDLSFPDRTIEGIVQQTTIVRHVKGSPDFHVVVDGEGYDTTLDIFDALMVGQRIQADVASRPRVIVRAAPVTAQGEVIRWPVTPAHR